MQSRREFLYGVLAGATALGSAVLHAPARATDIPSASKEKWITDALRQEKVSRGGEQLLLARFSDPIYVLRSTLFWEPKPGLDNKFSKVVVPIGFVTDLASIPPVFYSALRPDGDYVMSAIIHDYLYWSQEYSREDSDMIFDYSMEEYGIPKRTRAVIHSALRLFGGSAWESNRTLRAKGEQRILETLPPNSSISWAEWKKQKDVFAKQAPK